MKSESGECSTTNVNCDCDDINETNFFQSLKSRRRNKMLRTKWRTMSSELPLVIVIVLISNLCSIHCDNVPQEVYNFDPSWYHSSNRNASPVGFPNVNNDRYQPGQTGLPNNQPDVYSRPNAGFGYNSSPNEGFRRPNDGFNGRPGDNFGINSRPNEGFGLNDRRQGQGSGYDGRPNDEIGKPVGNDGFNKDLPQYDINRRPGDSSYPTRPLDPNYPNRNIPGNSNPIDTYNPNYPQTNDNLNPNLNNPRIVLNNEVDKPLDTQESNSNNINQLPFPSDGNNLPNSLNTPGVTQHPGGIIANKVSRLEKHFSPYLIKNDIIVEATGELVIESGVEVRFAPTVGITVRGVLTAKGTSEENIVLTAGSEPVTLDSPLIRLVDGPNILTGRVQLFLNGQWRSVCSNSRNWTQVDMETACRQLGYQGGTWWAWLDREPGPPQPRLLLEQPRCSGSEGGLDQCSSWTTKQLGSGVCEYHPDLAIQCLPSHIMTPNTAQHWRGISFQRAKYEKQLTQQDTLYVRTSLSELSHVQIKFAGSGKDYNASSAVEVLGVAPNMVSVSVLNSAYNGLNVTTSHGPVFLHNCTFRNNRGYGVYVNSSNGMSLLSGCSVLDNAGDGVRYVHHDRQYLSDRSEVFDFCTFPTTTRTASQTFPIQVTLEQSLFSTLKKDCHKYFFTRPGYKITLHFGMITTSKNNSGSISVYDGSSSNEPLIAVIPIANNTKPESITTLRSNVYVVFNSEPWVQTLAYLKLVTGPRRWYELNVTDSTIADNSGRGVAIEHMRSQLDISGSSISNNKHVAGVHVLYGSGHVNISHSRISFNKGNGVNISFTGGITNVTRSSLSSNTGFGLSLWLNDTMDPEFKSYHQETIVSYSEIFKNVETGVLIGNYCRENAIVNISSNYFNLSFDNAIEIKTCYRQLDKTNLLKLIIGHNVFVANKKLGILINPALNMNSVIEHNRFTKHTYGTILIKNPNVNFYDLLPVNIIIRNNEFYENKGVFVVSLGLSPYSEAQRIIFTWNFIRDNIIREPFDSGGHLESRRLVPRSRVAAAVVIGSANVQVFRNIIHNHESEYEIGSHLEDQSQVINCTYNWLGYNTEEKIFNRLFHRKDRYNLAKILYLPYLLHNSNPGASTIMAFATFVPQFHTPGSSIVGGEVDGIETLRAGEYVVVRDINVRPGGRLSLEPSVTLRFAPGVGMMVAGKLEARGRGPNDIRLTLKENRNDVFEGTGSGAMEEGVTGIPVSSDYSSSVRLVGGRSNNEGRLQVRLGDKWGTVCNYGWNIKAAALACHQLGLVLNPSDWNLEPNEMPQGGTAEDIIMSNVQCTEDDLDITECRGERAPHFENSCEHHHDVGLRCYEPTWAGLRLGALAERCDLQYITVERAGLLDYSTNEFKPAIQIDFSRHSLESIRVVDNAQDGIGVLYSDLYSGALNLLKNSEISNNRQHGITFKQLGLKITGTHIENNKGSGIHHDPCITSQAQRELAGWFKPIPDIESQYAPYTPFKIPYERDNIELEFGQTKYLITQRVVGDSINKTYNIRCQTGYVLGLQLLNPIQNRSTEHLVIYDGITSGSGVTRFDVKRDLVVFPTTSSTYGVVLEYVSGDNALGDVVLVISSIPAPQQTIPNKIVKGPIPTLHVHNTKLKNNLRGLTALYYNRYLTEIGEHYLRKSNESINIVNSDISFNMEEAMFIHSPVWNTETSNLSEISITINNTVISDNGKGIYQFSRDLRNSNNLFHWVLSDNTIERNNHGGFDISLPYVWQYNVNFTHSVVLQNTTWRNNRNFGVVIDGHYAQCNITANVFDDNRCKGGLISLRGMEKSLRILKNTILQNTGTFMIEFKADSQCDLWGELVAITQENTIKFNKAPSIMTPSSLIVFDGLQKVRVRRNLLSDNTLAYSLVAGMKTARLESTLDATENWWGTKDPVLVQHLIFDFDDWNDHALVNFAPYLIEDSFDGSLSVSWEQPNIVNVENLGGRLMTSLTLHRRDRPYVIKSDLTIMPHVTLTIAPGTVIEFAPRVGILVLGTLIAKGRRHEEIIMRPLPNDLPPTTEIVHNMYKRSLRLCSGMNCSGSASHEGFLEFWNATTLQWVPLCDSRFSERNAQVVCRQLGFEHYNAWVDHGPRVEFDRNSLSRIWTYPEPLQCSGEEASLDECPIRLNGQMYGRRPMCYWNSQFIFIHCKERNVPSNTDYWGGIRFASGDFESSGYEHRIHDSVTHETARTRESVLEHVNILGAGMLHHEKSPAVLSVAKSPSITHVNISQCLSHGISLISPSENIKLLFNWIQDVLGVGLTIASLTGEGRESSESSFTPLHELHVPYAAFGMVDMCDPTKELVVQERMVLYYKYDNNPSTCVKIFHSAYKIKPFGFRLLQFNLFNTSDSLSLYDGSLYNVSATPLYTVTKDSGLEKKFITTQSPTLSIKLLATGAGHMHGFIAEIVTLPISAIGFNRDVQHNITYSYFKDNWLGAVHYVSAGEVNPTVTVEWNQIRHNCAKLGANFTTCKGAFTMDVQNTQNLHFRNNLVEGNQGGLNIRADSRGSATSLKGWIHNNLFVLNQNNPTLYIEGRQSSPYQEVTIYRNYFTRNISPYKNTIVLFQVVSNFTFNYVHKNIGYHNLEVSGFNRVRLPIYQTTSHNGFYWNVALERDTKGTIIAGTAGQHYIDNILFNPDNDYEIVTVNKSVIDIWKTPIDARYNYWGYNETLAVGGRVRDRNDQSDLLEVEIIPFQMNNKTILDGKCPPGWNLIGDTCYIYVGAPMTFEQARDFCRADNASMPYVMGNYIKLYQFLKRQQETYNFYDRIWVQHIDRINECTVFVYQKIEVDHCLQLNPFICEMDPRVLIDPLSWRGDTITVLSLSGSILLFILIILIITLWCSKSKKRQVQRLERRNSIRQSLHSIHSLRSMGSTHNGFSDLSYQRKKLPPSQQPSPSLAKGSDYKKMNGSLDSSLDKSQFNSSMEEDTQSFDIYEAHNPPAAEAVKPSAYSISYRNEGFRDNSTFTSRDNSTWQSADDYLNNTSTLPMNASLSTYTGNGTVVTESSVSSKPEYQENGYQVYYERPKSSALLETNLDEVPSTPHAPPRSKSADILETNFDYMLPSHVQPAKRNLTTTFQPAPRSKSQPLETAM
uniref:Protein bark beetle n=2 Tax=Cacopsylla melanoneura TaxID=428564 RepID=A0A8D8T2J5_9HEMI